ncbi:hypothetical protein TIFTF001_028154 [Ficus carica]|uniref:Uncharacterized protein n=1 Tax=Ficus carica TaxID=3494 RepID=A0AA88DPK1_FICCA|nr:hypothetical protein TIFTF001_028154 [Ficus carica]
MDWPPQPLHSCAPGTDTYVKEPIIFVGVADVIVILAERKLTSYVYAVDKQPTGIIASRYIGGEMKGILVLLTATYVGLIELVRSVFGLKGQDKTIVIKHVVEPRMPPGGGQSDEAIQLVAVNNHIPSLSPPPIPPPIPSPIHVLSCIEAGLASLSSNCSIFPLAFGIVPSESNESRKWFF